MNRMTNASENIHLRTVIKGQFSLVLNNLLNSIVSRYGEEGDNLVLVSLFRLHTHISQNEGFDPALFGRRGSRWRQTRWIRKFFTFYQFRVKKVV